MPTLVLLSDTHMQHEQLEVPTCDVLVHAGDFTRRGTQEETEEFLRWFGGCRAEAKVLIAGNHDGWSEREPDAVRELAGRSGVTYLDDEEAQVGGLRVWGSPVTPAFRSMAFNRKRGAAIRRHWDRIPAGLDLLVTHGPPRGLGDRVIFGAHVGCDDLREAVRARPPRLHVFGHIHEAAGAFSAPDTPTRFLNVATSRFLVGVRRPVMTSL
jgi:Icc-related predicted phosphoesterase